VFIERCLGVCPGYRFGLVECLDFNPQLRQFVVQLQLQFIEFQLVVQLFQLQQFVFEQRRREPVDWLLAQL
jgi:hypothetical protein